MKLCAANLVDNLYKNNYRIETPLVPQRGIIIGSPKFEYGELKIKNSDSKKATKFNVGEFANISVNIINNGATGINDVTLNVNGVIVDTKRIPIVENNLKLVTFDYLFSEPGEHRISIGSSPSKIISVEGKPLSFFYDSINVSSNIIPAGNEITINARVKKVSNKESKTEAILYANSKVVATQQIEFGNSDTKNIEFKYSPKAGNSKIRIGNSKSIDVFAYPFTNIDISKVELAQYCDTRAEPHKIDIDQKNNKYKIEASGIDFYHGEDSYASVYLKKPIKGNFVATVKLTGFGERTNEWFRSGLFVRNDMEKSFGTGEGSKGSVLMFASPGRAGMNWDEHGDGCMHKANSENHPVKDTYPIWIKLVRHGNSFSGYVSYDGVNWIIERHTQDLPGVNEAVHLGLAAGAPDQLVYFVEFEDFQIIVEK
jgi:regulation of enolase protein 1 (concanavalin A-like superfamily)